MAAETEIEKLLVRLVGDATSYQRMLKDAQASSRRAATAVEVAGRRMELVQKRLLAVGGALRSAGRAMAGMGRRMSMYVTAPIAAIGVAGVLAFGSFDKAMTESLSIMQATEEQAKRMRETALSLAQRGVQGPTQLAEAYFFLASAGMDAERSMKALTAVAQFATAGAFDMATATDLLTDAQTAMGMASKDAQQNLEGLIRLSDVFVKANQIANTSVQQVSEAMTADAATAARGMGQSLESVVAVLAAYASAGKKAHEAGNLYGRGVRLLSKAYRDNKEAFEKFQIRVVNRATGEYRNFIDIIADMERAFAGMKKPQRSAALEMLGFEARVQKAITPLLGLSGTMREYQQQLGATGATQEVARKQLAAFSNQMRIFWNQVKVVGIEIGEVLAPMIKKLTEHVKKALEFWKKLNPEVKKTAVVVALVTAAIGPLLIGLGGLVTVAGIAVIAIGSMIGILGALLSPTVLVTAALAALGAAVFHYVGGTEAVIADFGSWWRRAKEDAVTSLEAIRNALTAGDIPLAFKVVTKTIELEWARMTEGLKMAWLGFNSWFMDNVWWINPSLGLAQAVGDVEKWAQGQPWGKKGRREQELQQFEQIRASAKRLKEELGGLIDEAALKKDVSKLDAALGKLYQYKPPKLAQIELAVMKVPKIEVPDLPKIPDPPPINLTFDVGMRQAAAAGSAEARSRTAEFQAAIAAPTKSAGPRPVAAAGKAIAAGAGRVGEGAADYLKELLELAKKHWQGPVIEIDPADLEG